MDTNEIGAAIDSAMLFLKDRTNVEIRSAFLNPLDSVVVEGMIENVSHKPDVAASIAALADLPVKTASATARTLLADACASRVIGERDKAVIADLEEKIANIELARLN